MGTAYVKCATRAALLAFAAAAATVVGSATASVTAITEMAPSDGASPHAALDTSHDTAGGSANCQMWPYN